MQKKIFSVFVVTLLMIATGITVAQTLKLKTNDSEPEKGATGWGWYNPAGAWMRSDKHLIGIVTYVGWGRYAMSYEYIHDPSWPVEYYGTLFPTTVGVTDGRGEYVMSGKNTYDFSLIANGYDENYEITYYSIYSGITTITSENDQSSTFTLKFYSSDQDPFDENSEPLFTFGPYEFTYERIPIVA